MKKLRQLNRKDLLLRITAGVIMAIVLLILVTFSYFVIREIHNDGKMNAQNGLIAISETTLQAQPTYLSGGWDAFPGIVCKTKEDVASLGQQNQRIEMPLGSITQAKQDATYRLYLQIPQNTSPDLYLAIPNYQGSVEIFLNGIKQQPISNDQRWISYRTLDRVFSLKDLTKSSSTQELVITGHFSKDADTLYRRSVLLGTMPNINALVTSDSSTEMLIMGMMLLVLVSGYVFMLFRPGHLLISLITVFDTLLMCKIFPTMNYVFSFSRSVLPGLAVSDQTRVALSLFFLMLAGFTGCVLAKTLFDPNGLTPKWITKPPAIAYLIFAVVFPFKRELFEQYGIFLLIVVYIWTFAGVFMQFTLRWKQTKRRGYYGFQFFKTAYVGGVIFFDLLFWKRYTDIAIWFYLYIIFFLMHVVVRLYDNNRSYQSVERLNLDLEKTVDERTKELLQANQILSELSNRDPLTRTFNRLYFEGLMEQLLDDPKELYVALLDLDFFKNVNDTYGHGTGDEMLCRLTAIVQQVVDEKAIFARIGGEEFVLVYHEQPYDEVLASIYALHHALAENATQNKQYTTASIGVASWCNGDTEKSLMKKADEALYQAKHQGRNQVVLHGNMNLPLNTADKTGGEPEDEAQ